MLVYAAVRDDAQHVAALQQPGSAIRESLKTSAGVEGSPLRVTSWTAGATRSMKDSAPVSAESKRTVVTDL